jgi:hypothetical protein
MFRILLISIIIVSCAAAQESRDGRYRVEQERHVSNDPDDEHSITYTVYDRDDREIYSVVREVTFDTVFPSVGIFESGALMLLHSFTCKIELFDPEGNPVAAVFPVSNAELEHERNMLFTLHDSFAVVLISEPSRKKSKLVIVDEEGAIQLNQEIDVSYGSGLMLSPDGSIIAAGLYGWEDTSLINKTKFLTPDGIVRGSVDTGFTKGYFSDDGAWFLGITNKKVSEINLENFTVTSTVIIPPGQIILDAIRESNGLIILSAEYPELKDGSWIYRDARIIRVDADGTIFEERRLAPAEFSTASILQIDDTIRIRMDDSVLE